MSVRTMLSAAVASTLALAGSVAAQDFSGVTVNVLTRPGYVIAGPLIDRGKDFEEMTGAKIVVTEVPFAEIFPKIQNDWATGTNSIDVGVFAAGWGVELDAAVCWKISTRTSPKMTKSNSTISHHIFANSARRSVARPSC